MNRNQSLLISFFYILLSMDSINARKKTKRHEVISNEVISSWDDSTSVMGKGVLGKGHKANYEEMRRRQNLFQEAPDVKDMNKLFDMIQNMSLDVINLKTTIANIKYQNHIIYKQLKKIKQ